MMHLLYVRTSCFALFATCLLAAHALFAQCVAPCHAAAGPITPNQSLKGSDSDRIEAAIAKAVASGGNVVEIPKKNLATKRPLWLLDRAILLPSDFTLILNDCRVQLAPGVQDNLISNAGSRTKPLTANQNIRILGRGHAVLSGGTCAHWKKPGDANGWRTIGILLCNVQGFTIQGFQMEETQTWAISVENGCSNGRIADIDFANSNKYPNQDGVDIRKGCHDILIENITGFTGDDTVALTGLRDNNKTRGLASMQIGGTHVTGDDDIHDITVRNIKAFPSGGHHIVRLLNHDGIKLYNITVSNVIDTSGPKDKRARAAIKIGDPSYFSLSRGKLGETFNITIDGVSSRAETLIRMDGPIEDAILRNITATDPSSRIIDCGSAPTQNVTIHSQSLRSVQK